VADARTSETAVASGKAPPTSSGIEAAALYIAESPSIAAALATYMSGLGLGVRTRY
jgi:hypothetical protein